MDTDTIVAIGLAIALAAVTGTSLCSRRHWRTERRGLLLETGRMQRLLAEQRSRMKVMAQNNLDLRQQLEMPPVAGRSTPHTDCDHPDATHGAWGCTTDGCRCLLVRSRLDDIAKAVA